jgi:signal transduction histidine kinase
MEFEEVRLYQMGDDVRTIDWNVSARYGEPYVKIFREERELTVLLLVDVSRSLSFGTRDQLKREIAIEICATLAFSAIPFSMAFAITRYGLMDIDTLVDNTVIYALTLGGLIVLDIGAMALLGQMKPVGIAIGGVGSSMLSVWITLAAYLPVRNKVTHQVKRLFKRQPYNPHQIALALSADFLLETDRTVILQKTMRVIDAALHPTGMTAFLYQEGRRIDWPGAPFQLSLPDDFEAWVSRPQASKQGEPLDGGGMRIPFNGTNRPLGFFLLNEKYSRNLYTREDRSLLEVMANQTALAIERINAVEVAIQKESAARAAQDRISRDIHDSIGGAMTNALMLVDMIKRDRNETRIEGLHGILSEGLSDLRNLLWMLEGRAFTVGSLMAYLREKFGPMTDEARTGIAMTATFISENEGLPMPETSGLNLFRILQESVTNVLKHAEATRIDIVVLEAQGRLSASVRDNGKGFDPDVAFAYHYGLRNMKKRAEEIGAKLAIVSEIGVETTVSLALVL